MFITWGGDEMGSEYNYQDGVHGVEPYELPGFEHIGHVSGELSRMRRDSAVWAERYDMWFSLLDWERAPLAHARFADEFADNEAFGIAIDEAAGLYCAECNTNQVGARGDMCADCEDNS